MTAQAVRAEIPQTQTLNLTSSAQSKLAELLSGAGEEVLGVRVFVAGGGCGGMGYGMTYADQVTDYDHVIEHDQCKVIVDAVAFNFLRGAEIDFTHDGMNSSFVFRNAFQAPRTGGGGCGAAGCGGGGCGR
jgi:iron-sulfur cluster insertion protein